MERNRIAVDVICKHTKNGNLIPMRIRVKDEEGEYQTYTIKEYRDVSHRGTRTMPDELYKSITNYMGVDIPESPVFMGFYRCL